MEEIRFTKMHGIGNDYIYIDCMESEPESPTLWRGRCLTAIQAWAAME